MFVGFLVYYFSILLIMFLTAVAVQAPVLSVAVSVPSSLNFRAIAFSDRSSMIIPSRFCVLNYLTKMDGKLQ